MYYGAPPIVTNGLVLALDAGNTKSYVSGSTTWRNLTNPLVSGSLINGPTFNNNNGGSIMFDGVDDYVSLSSYADDSLFNNTWPNGISMECVIKLITPPSPIIDGKSIFVRSNGSAGSNFFNFSIQSTKQLRFWIGAFQPAFTTTLLVNEVIYHATLTWDKSVVRFYINGNLDSITGNTNTLTTTSSPILNIGSATGAFPGWEFPGNIYYFRVYNRALSQQEITQNYNATKTRFGLS
jgi:hypothetical protein